MIVLTERDGTAICVNANVIETLEGSSGTVITLTTGKRFMVRESIEEVISRVIGFLRKCTGSVEDPGAGGAALPARATPGLVRRLEEITGDRVRQDLIGNADCAAPRKDTL